MAHHALASQESYNPNHLLDILLGKMQLKNDAALSRMLEVAPPVISKIRHHRRPQRLPNSNSRKASSRRPPRQALRLATMRTDAAGVTGATVMPVADCGSSAAS
jgi:hypothetical protein